MPTHTHLELKFLFVIFNFIFLLNVVILNIEGFESFIKAILITQYQCVQLKLFPLFLQTIKNKILETVWISHPNNRLQFKNTPSYYLLTHNF